MVSVAGPYIWVTDTPNNRVEKFNSSGSWLLTIPGSGCTGTSVPVCTAGAGNGQFGSNGVEGIAVDGSGNVAFHSVKVGPRVDTLWVLEEGVKPGDKVVVEGLQRVQEGMTVSAKPAPPTPPAGAPSAQQGGGAN